MSLEFQLYSVCVSATMPLGFQFKEPPLSPFARRDMHIHFMYAYTLYQWTFSGITQ